MYCCTHQHLLSCEELLAGDTFRRQLGLYVLSRVSSSLSRRGHQEQTNTWPQRWFHMRSEPVIFECVNLLTSDTDWYLYFLGLVVTEGWFGSLSQDAASAAVYDCCWLIQEHTFNRSSESREKKTQSPESYSVTRVIYSVLIIGRGIEFMPVVSIVKNTVPSKGLVHQSRPDRKTRWFLILMGGENKAIFATLQKETFTSLSKSSWCKRGNSLYRIGEVGSSI